MPRPLADELRRAREALERGFPEEALERLEPWEADPEAEEVRREARRALDRPGRGAPLPPEQALAARRRAMVVVAVVTVATAVAGLVAAVLIGLMT